MSHPEHSPNAPLVSSPQDFVETQRLPVVVDRARVTVPPVAPPSLPPSDDGHDGHDSGDGSRGSRWLKPVAVAAGAILVVGLVGGVAYTGLKWMDAKTADGARSACTTAYATARDARAAYDRSLKAAKGVDLSTSDVKDAQTLVDLHSVLAEAGPAEPSECSGDAGRLNAAASTDARLAELARKRAGDLDKAVASVVSNAFLKLADDADTKATTASGSVADDAVLADLKDAAIRAREAAKATPTMDAYRSFKTKYEETVRAVDDSVAAKAKADADAKAKQEAEAKAKAEAEQQAQAQQQQQSQGAAAAPDDSTLDDPAQRRDPSRWGLPYCAATDRGVRAFASDGSVWRCDNGVWSGPF